MVRSREVLKVVFNRPLLVESSEYDGSGGSRKAHGFGDNQSNALGESDI